VFAGAVTGEQNIRVGSFRQSGRAPIRFSGKLLTNLADCDGSRSIAAGNRNLQPSARNQQEGTSNHRIFPALTSTVFSATLPPLEKRKLARVFTPLVNPAGRSPWEKR
jgi:hypothetical protein